MLSKQGDSIMAFPDMFNNNKTSCNESEN